VFENRVLWRIFRPKKERNEVKMECRKLHNEELNDLYSIPNIFQVINLRIRWAGHIAGMGEKRAVYRVLVGRPDGTSPFGRPNIIITIMVSHHSSHGT
jgi:hypothetical protein